MFDDQEEIAYVLISDPEDLPSFATPASSARPADERRILLDEDLRAQVIVDMEKLNSYFKDYAHVDPDPFQKIWKHVRNGDEEALREFPFLLTAGRLQSSVRTGKVALQPASNMSEPEHGRWDTADALGIPPHDVVALAHRFSPVLSLAHSIYEGRHVPEVGSDWEVKAHLLEEDHARLARIWHEYTCQVVLSDGLIIQAMEAARRFAGNPNPLGWIMRWGRISLLVGAREADAKGFRTEQADFEELGQLLQAMYNTLPGTPEGIGILQYYMDWNIHIPTNRPKTFYHGLCHGFRVTHDLSQALAGDFPDSQELFIFEELLAYLAAKAAEAYLDKRRETPVIAPFSGVFPLPASAAKGVTLFQVSDEGIDRLGNQIDVDWLARFATFSRGPVGTSGFPSGDKVLDPEYGADFYAGVVHAMALSERIAAIYEREVFSPEIRDSCELEVEMRRACCVAAKHWKRAVHGQ